MVHNSRAQDRLIAARDAIKPQAGYSLCRPLREFVHLQKPQPCAFLTLVHCFVEVC